MTKDSRDRGKSQQLRDNTPEEHFWPSKRIVRISSGFNRFAMRGPNVYLEAKSKNLIELAPKVAKTFVKHMRAFYCEPSAIKRDRIAGDAAHLLKPHLPPGDRKLQRQN